MTAFTNAVLDAREQLHRNGYDPTKAIVYTHPTTLDDAKSELDYQQPFTNGSQVYGMQIESTPNVPVGLVVLVHLDAMRHGPKAIAFKEVKYE